MSRIADGLQKAKKEGVQSNPPEFVPDATAQFSFRRLSDIRIPWVLDMESNSAPAVAAVNVVDEPRRVEQPPRVDEPPKIVAWEEDVGEAGDFTGVFREKGQQRCGRSRSRVPTLVARSRRDRSGDWLEASAWHVSSVA